MALNVIKVLLKANTMVAENLMKLEINQEWKRVSTQTKYWCILLFLIRKFLPASGNTAKSMQIPSFSHY